ncbi:MAG TPA: ferritin family protein [Phycisphaerae bacterium]|nr:ferritin family protein [Phycisphaerae bacterium]HUX15742.1 ferritin family protein [Phycisphaerae bacterium]
MALSEKMCGILAMGIEKERGAHDFYVRAGEDTKHPLGKKMFGRLADQETQHEQLLRSWSDQGACPADADLPSTDPGVLKRARAEMDKVVEPETGDLEAIELGQEMERKAIAFYQTSAAKAEDEASKDLLMRLKAEEDEHLALLSDLYEYMKDPNLWSVREGRAHFDS